MFGVWTDSIQVWSPGGCREVEAILNIISILWLETKIQGRRWKSFGAFQVEKLFLPYIMWLYIYFNNSNVNMLKKYWKNLHHFRGSKGSDLDSDVALIEFSHSHNILLQYLKIGSKIMFSTFYLTFNKMVKWAIDTTFLHWRNLQNWNSFYLSSGRNLCLKFLVLLGLISHPSWQSGK